MANAPHVLIVEDNPLDAELTRWSLAEAGLKSEPVVVSDGEEAMQVLRGEGAFENQRTPDLVILDLNLRLVDGPVVLQFIRDQPELAKICVIVLSSSPEDVMRTKAARADFYFSKSGSLEAYTLVGQQILACYFEGRHAHLV